MLPSPWALLSAGVGFEAFCDQLSMAMDEGAAGYIVGRAVWREAASIDDAVRRDAIAELVVPRLETLARIV
jgi:tagatose-1,6-bisphosphate aldolase